MNEWIWNLESFVYSVAAEICPKSIARTLDMLTSEFLLSFWYAVIIKNTNPSWKMHKKGANFPGGGTPTPGSGSLHVSPPTLKAFEALPNEWWDRPTKGRVAALPVHGGPSLDCWGCVGGVVCGGTAGIQEDPGEKKIWNCWSEMREKRSEGSKFLQLRHFPPKNWESRGGHKGWMQINACGITAVEGLRPITPKQ